MTCGSAASLVCPLLPLLYRVPLQAELPQLVNLRASCDRLIAAMAEQKYSRDAEIMHTSELVHKINEALMEEQYLRVVQLRELEVMKIGLCRSAQLTAGMLHLQQAEPSAVCALCMLCASELTALRASLEVRTNELNLAHQQTDALVSAMACSARPPSTMLLHV